MLGTALITIVHYLQLEVVQKNGQRIFSVQGAVGCESKKWSDVEINLSFLVIE